MRKARVRLRVIAGSICVFLTLQTVAAQKSNLAIRWQQYTTTNGLPSNRVLCVAVNAEQAWAGTDNGLVLVENGQVAKIYQPQDGLVARVVTALAIDQETGDLWIATYGGLSHYSAGSFQNYTSLTSGLANDIVYDVAVQHGVVWAATAAGLSRLNIRTGSWSNFDNRNTPMIDPWPVAVTVDEHSVFVATWGSGVLEYNIADSRWTPHGNAEKSETAITISQPTLNFATGVAYDRKSGVIWTATQGGLGRQDKNKWRHYTSANSDLASDLIHAIRLHDDKLWLCTDQGLSIFDDKTSTWETYRVISRPQNREERVIAKKHESPHGGKENNVFNIAFDGSKIWLATEAGLSAGTIDQTMPIGQSRRAVGIKNQAIEAVPRSKPVSKSAPSLYSSDLSTINIGFFGPIENSPDVAYGFSMMHGAQLAIEEANDRGGYSDRIHQTQLKYELRIHNDSAPWGASTTEPVSMVLDEHVVAILGSIDGSTTHTMLRIAAELGVPVVNTGTTDPTITDTETSRLLHLMPDDRQQSRALMRYIAGQKRIKKIGIIREDARYARVGTEAFTEEARSTGRISVIEERFQPGDSDFSPHLRELRDANVDGVILWCHPAEGAKILKQMHALGMRMPTFGPGHLASPELIELAGTAAEGFVATSVLNPERSNERSQCFERNYKNRFSESPDIYASYAYDGINLLIAAIEKVGPNRKKIAEVLRQHRFNSYDGASGQLSFDGSLNNVAPLAMARVEGGRFVYWVPGAVRR